jgi:hypothetical protein
MSALRQLLSSVWAAVWLSWRMAGVRVRRIVRRGASAPAPKLYLPVAEVPVGGVG